MTKRLLSCVFILGMVGALAIAAACSSSTTSQSIKQQSPRAAAPAKAAASGGGIVARPKSPAPAAPAAAAVAAHASAPTSPVQEATRPARSAPAPTTSSSSGPEGTLRVAATSVSFPGTVPSKLSCTSQGVLGNYGVYETPKYWATDSAVIEPNLATGWSYNGDATVLTFNLKEGVQFHGGWGEMTSADWKFSHDNMVADGSIHSNIFISKARVQEVKTPDAYTAEFHLDKPNIFFISAQFNGPGGCGSFDIVSKNRVDTLGAEAAHLDLTGGTGPYKINSWNSGDIISVEAVPNHHRRTSAFAVVEGVEIKETATALAALRTGEVDIANIPAPQADRMTKAGLDVRKLNGGGYQRLYPQGKFCMKETVDGVTVDPYPRPGYDPSKPWVGDCDDPAQQENARKVRWAVSMSIDRQAIVDNILGGYGRPAGPAEMLGVTYEKYFQDKWSVPYDPEKAKQYIKEAGYPNGFDALIRVTTGSHPLEIEVGEAVGEYMKAVGINPTIEVLTYGGNRPSVVARIRSDWWMRSSGPGLGLNPEIAMLRRNPVGAFNPGFEVEEPLQIIKKIDACTTQDCMDKLREEQWDWWHDSQQIVGVVELFGLMAVNPEVVGTWNMPIGSPGLSSFEYIEKP